jgi:hypothetical protein
MRERRDVILTKAVTHCGRPLSVPIHLSCILRTQTHLMSVGGVSVPFPTVDAKGKKSKKAKKVGQEGSTTEMTRSYQSEGVSASTTSEANGSVVVNDVQSSNSSSTSSSAQPSSTSTHFFPQSSLSSYAGRPQMDAYSSADYDDDEEMKYTSASSHRSQQSGDDNPLDNVGSSSFHLTCSCRAPRTQNSFVLVLRCAR